MLRTFLTFVLHDMNGTEEFSPIHRNTGCFFFFFIILWNLMMSRFFLLELFLIATTLRDRLDWKQQLAQCHQWASELGSGFSWSQNYVLTITLDFFCSTDFAHWSCLSQDCLYQVPQSNPLNMSGYCYKQLQPGEDDGHCSLT